MTNVSNDHVAKQPQRWKWRWWHIALAVFGAFVALSMLSGSPELHVVLSGNGQISIQNIGRKPIDIKDGRVNDTNACKILSLRNIGNPDASPWPLHLEVGQATGLIPRCAVVRISIDTSAGSASYSFR